HQSGSPYTIRYAGDPTGGGLTGGCSSRGCQSSQPGARNTARGKFINYADVTLSRIFPLGTNKIEIRADVRSQRLPRTAIRVRDDVQVLKGHLHNAGARGFQPSE